MRVAGTYPVNARFSRPKHGITADLVKALMHRLVSKLPFLRVGLSLGIFLLAVPNGASGQPVIEKQPMDLLGVPIDGEALFSVQAKGEELEYQWRLNGMNVPGATGSSLRLDKLSLENFGTYTVAVADGKGSTNSEEARLVPLLLPARAADEFTKGYIIGPDNDLDPFRGMFLIHNREATKETGEPNHAGRKGGKSIWFTWVAPASGVVKFSARGSGFDTLLAAYTGDSVDKLGQVSLTSADDDRGGFFTSEIQFNAVQGVGYAVAVDGYEGASGDIVLRWMLDVGGSLPQLVLEPRSQAVGPGDSVQLNVNYEGGTAQWFRFGSPTEVTGKSYTIDKINESHVGRYYVLVSGQERHELTTVPANIQINLTDDKTDTNAFAHDKLMMAMSDRDPKEQTGKGPMVANSASRGYTTTQIFSTIGSTKDPGEPNHAGVPGGASEWFVYSPPESGMMNVTTDGSNYDTVVAVYTSSGFGYDTFNLVASSNRPGNGNDRARFETEAGISYFIAVDGVGGASGTVKLNIHLGNPCTISSQPQSVTVGAGTNATFSVVGSGTPAPTYQWYFNDAVIPNATSSTYTRLGAQPGHAGFYKVLLSNAIQAVYSDDVTLTVLNPPAITAHPTNRTVIAGANVVLSVTATGSAPLRYQWRRNGTNLIGSTNATLSLLNIQAANAGTYHVRVTNSVGVVLSSNAIITVNSAPVITAHPQSKTVAQNGSITLLASASGSPTPTFQWRKNGVSLAGKTASSLLITNFTVSDAGDYMVVASNSVGTASSTTATLAMNTPLRADSFIRGTNGTFQISIIGEANTFYVLERTENFTQWFPVVTNSSPSGFLTLTDTNAPGSGVRFYRTVSQ